MPGDGLAAADAGDVPRPESAAPGEAREPRGPGGRHRSEQSARGQRWVIRIRFRFMIVYLKLNGAFWANCTIFIRGKQVN